MYREQKKRKEKTVSSRKGEKTVERAGKKEISARESRETWRTQRENRGIVPIRAVFSFREEVGTVRQLQYEKKKHRIVQNYR